MAEPNIARTHHVARLLFAVILYVRHIWKLNQAAMKVSNMDP